MTESHYWAKFRTVENDRFRFDTRIYLAPVSHTAAGDSCVGAVVGKNPGAATPMAQGSGLQPLALNGDKFLPNVRSIISKAYARADTPIPVQSYIQVLNLFYLCNRNLQQAVAAFKEHTPRACLTEKHSFPWVWYQWGKPDTYLDQFKERFAAITASHHFYYDQALKQLATERPAVHAFPRHIERMKHELVLPHLATIVAAP